MSHWLRPHYQEGGGEPYLFYAVFGNFPTRMAPLSASRYRSSGLATGLTLDHQDPDYFREGLLWEQLEQSNPRAASVVSRAGGCLVLRGQPHESGITKKVSGLASTARAMAVMSASYCSKLSREFCQRR